MAREIKYFSGSANFRTSGIKANVSTSEPVIDQSVNATSQITRTLVSNGAGTVLSLPLGGTTDDYLISTDYSNTWTTKTLPAGATIVAGIYAGGQYIIIPTSGTIAYNSPNGLDWTPRTLAASASWANITYGNGKYLVTGYNNTSAQTSTDGITWSTQTLPASASGAYNNSSFGAGRFVYAPNTTNTMYYSTDAVTWTSAALALGGFVPIAVTFTNNQFLIYTSSTSYAYSSDGISWTNSVIPIAMLAPINVCSGGDLSLAIAANGDMYQNGKVNAPVLCHSGCVSSGATYTSCFDGKNIIFTCSQQLGRIFKVVGNRIGGFVSRTLPATATWSDVTYGASLGLWVSISSGSTNAASSSNGTTWTARALPSSAAWTSMAFGAGTFVAISNATTSAAYSTNGTSWTASTLTGICSGGLTYGTKFVGVGNSVCSHSADGITWTSATFPVNATAITYGNGMYVAVGNGVAASSPDGTTWTSRTNAQNSNSVAYGNNIYIATATAASTYTISTDGLTWTSAISFPSGFSTNPSRVTFINGLFVVSDSGTSKYLTSVDGTNWNIHRYDFNFSPSTAIFSSDGIQFLTLSKGASGSTIYQSTGSGTLTSNSVDQFTTGRIHSSLTANIDSVQFLNNGYVGGSFYSSNGMSFTPVNYSASNDVLRSAYGAGVYIAVTSTNTGILYSTDGVNWARRNRPSTFTASATSVIYANSLFVVLAASGTVGMTSSDGTSWSTMTTISGDWRSIAYGASTYLATQLSSTLTNTYMTSSNGTSWTSRTFPAAIYCRQVIFGGSNFYVLTAADNSHSGNNGYLLKSSNGITWSNISLPEGAVRWMNLQYAANGLWAITDKGVIYVSYDAGNNWTLAADLRVNSASNTVYSMTISSNGAEALVIGSGGLQRRVRLAQAVLYEVPASRTAKVTFNYLKNTLPNITVSADVVPIWTATTINSTASSTITGTPIYLGAGSQVVTNTDLDYSFMVIEEY